ncbi:MAG: hypothetical protein IPG10_00380 [Flavobacteriales bacterium]|nr:hypothetical protein [Flavobacteriales bacterium]MBK6755612.1 hypothetical protein [Flavobacteriales bacterium]MBK7083840.1 hypothetical protein [Flavobacteriales bacterium]MBK7271482.1 hypothetical protein [Flavobacteriales bacterium]MBK7754563.1 hypothetical protein [Flavobacteriales bacterium]
MTQIKQYDLVRIVRLHNAPEYYGSLEHDERLPAIGDIGCVIEIFEKPGIPDGYMVECPKADTGENIWQCIFMTDELEPVEDLTRVTP